MTVKTETTKQHILNTGYELILSKGFSAMGLAELLKTAEVPKGSFYHYFNSKEHFGEAVIADYFSNYVELLDTLLVQTPGSGLERLMNYFERWLEFENGRCKAHKCLIVKLGAEVSDLSDTMREELLKGAELITAAIAQCIELGIKDGSIDSQNSLSSANTLYHLWLGATLMSKLTQSLEPLQSALNATRSLLKK
ncbi:TetR/AcrR family transcriptional regulator [Endozoicomonas ascidiicola]|uniref:TetR/AcrR family transcriptional regulator n=1 Tax=Endozoicomonas ascidiicola TaxID=1698521 RepID=UPI0008362404|nr:TetR/AcrR family transcriptional regulator [Endozoicomonas ascidiicola]